MIYTNIDLQNRTLIFLTLTLERKGSSSDSTLAPRLPRPFPRFAIALRATGLGFGFGGGAGRLRPPPFELNERKTNYHKHLLRESKSKFSYFRFLERPQD